MSAALGARRDAAASAPAVVGLPRPSSACQDSRMRCVAGVGLLALVGCNQIFSLAPTREFDASISIDVIPDLPHVELTYQVAGVLPSGAPDPAIAFAPLVPAPLVRIATLDGAFETASYSPTDGWILIPRSYLGITWRLEYTIVDGVSAPIPHEVQWAPEDKLGHVTVPLFGRVALEPLPVGGVYKIKPNGVLGYNNPTVLTTGLWTEGDARVDLGDPSHTTVDYAFSDANWLSGKKGRLDPARGDRAFLLDYVAGTQGVERDCRIAIGSVMLDSAAVQTGTPTVQIPTTSWDTARKPVKTTAIDLTIVGRLQNKLGKLHTAVTGSVLVGSSPSISMPGLTNASRFLPLSLPVMATLLQCPYSPNPGDLHPAFPLPDALQPPGLDPFPRILHAQLVDPRTVLGVTLNSGMEAVIASGEPSGFTIAFPAAIPTRMTLATPTKDTVDLAGDSEQLDIGPAAGVFRLDFTPETGTDLRADYHDVVLHRFDGAQLTTDRIYTVTAPTVRIDGSVLRPGTLYVLEIRSHKGHPAAARGDFAQVDYPYGAAIVFTRTFKTS
jgi:hypothetical protein